ARRARVRLRDRRRTEARRDLEARRAAVHGETERFGEHALRRGTRDAAAEALFSARLVDDDEDHELSFAARRPTEGADRAGVATAVRLFERRERVETRLRDRKSLAFPTRALGEFDVDAELARHLLSGARLRAEVERRLVGLRSERRGEAAHEGRAHLL